jgi:iron(III) transport system permease protein
MVDLAIPAGRPVKGKLARDDFIMRGYMIVIAVYLIIALALPLYAMLSKSFSTYSFDLNAYEFQVSDEAGIFGESITAAALNEAIKAVSPAELSTSADGRLPAARFFPDFSFRSAVKYRIRGLSDDVVFLIGSNFQKGTEWREVDSNTFRRVMLRPARARGFANYITYFSTPSLFRSIQNSLFIATLSTIITVSLAFGFAYALNRSQMRFKGVFRLIAMAPILVPSLLPGIALVYLFGNQGMIRGLLLGESIYGPIGIVIGSVFFTFPHAMIIIMTALAISDARLYEASVSLRASRWSRPAKGHRRPIQHAGGGYLQAGHRPAEFRDGSRCLRRPPHSRAVCLHHRPDCAEKTGGAALGSFRSIFAKCEQGI